MSNSWTHLLPAQAPKEIWAKAATLIAPQFFGGFLLGPSSKSETTVHALLNFGSLLLQGNIPPNHHLIPGHPCTLSVCWHVHTANTGVGIVHVTNGMKTEKCVNVRERKSGRTRCERIPCIHNQGHYLVALVIKLAYLS